MEQKQKLPWVNRKKAFAMLLIPAWFSNLRTEQICLGDAFGF